MRRALVCLLAAALLAACGFQLRGAWALPYESLHIALPDTSVIGAGLKRQIIAGGGTRLADAPSSAEATLVQSAEVRDRQILSLSTAGRVREVRLRYRFAYRIVNPQGRDLVPPTGVELTRDLTYDDSAVLAKEQEETILWRDMENDLVQQLLRRIATVKPVPPAEDS